MASAMLSDVSSPLYSCQRRLSQISTRPETPTTVTSFCSPAYSLGIRSAIGSTGKEKSLKVAGAGHGQLVDLFLQHIPGFCRIDKQTAVQTFGDDKAAAQLFPELGRNEQAAFGVDIVFEFAVHSFTTPIPPVCTFRHCSPLSATLFFYYTVGLYELQVLFIIIFYQKAAILCENTGFSTHQTDVRFSCFSTFSVLFSSGSFSLSPSFSVAFLSSLW